MAMGGASIGLVSPFHINVTNPATLSGLDTLSFVFEGGLHGRMSQFRTDSDSKLDNNASLGYLYMGFPIAKWLKTGFGLQPYSSMGYAVTSIMVDPLVGKQQNIFEGNGGTNQAFAAFSVEPVKGLSVGVTASYLFGTLEKSNILFFPDSINMINTRKRTTDKVKDFTFTYGALYHKEIKKNMELGVGMTWSPQFLMGASQEMLVESFKRTSSGFDYVKDTILLNETSGDYTMPASYGVGLMLRKSNRWTLAADYKMQEWSKFKKLGTSDLLKNSSELSLGMEILPRSTVLSGYFKRLAYRFGLRYADTYLSVNDTQLKEYGISFGIGLPLKRSASTINIGLELGTTGTTDKGLIREDYLRFTFSMSVFERWFAQRKFN